jgi:hypothetical protein
MNMVFVTNHIRREAYSGGDLAIHERRQEEVASLGQFSILSIKIANLVENIADVSSKRPAIKAGDAATE